MMQGIFGRHGLLAKALAGYESRPAQEEMAVAVAAALGVGGTAMNPQAHRMLAVEAETGIGKTLAYLVPAALSRQKVVVSTNTLNLQEQILHKEIPFIRQQIDPECTALCVKGRRNYLCRYRWRHFLNQQQQRLFKGTPAVDAINAWLKETSTGDRAELDWLPDDSPLWAEISATTSQCLGSHCPDEAGCFVNQLRKKAAAARLLIVNHHLFFSDLALRRGGRGEVLPRYESVIFDEAHHLENVATTYFGTSFSHYQVFDLINDIEKLAKAGLGKKKRKKLLAAGESLRCSADAFVAIFPAEKGKFPLKEFIATRPGWQTDVQDISENIRHLGNHLHELIPQGEIWYSLERRCDELLDGLQTITANTVESSGDGQDPYVRWFERRERTLSLSASPIEVAGVLQESFYTQVRSCIFTSATLTVGGKFDYFFERLGLPPETRTLSLPSPFDYGGRSLLYIPAHDEPPSFPEPGQKEFATAVQQGIAEIVLATRGRALVLFTSIQAMRSARQFLAGRLPYPLLMQGEAPKNLLLESFRSRADSVLLAVASFWEGIDVPGESLSCVIIDKLPFEVPSDPIIAARIDRIRDQGGNPFLDFQVPRAILALRQGVGRLMRASTDKGLLAIMDIRLFTKGYGRLFRESLPPSPVTRRLADIEDFFQ